MKDYIVSFLRDEDGATAIEYGLIAGLVSVAILVVLQGLSTSLVGIFTTISTALSGASGTP